MDVQTAPPGPALALGIAVALAVLAVALAGGLLLARPGLSRRAATGTPSGPVEGFPDDDLPVFRECPPGFPGALVPGSRATLRRPAPAAPARGPVGTNPVRVLTAMVLAALVLAALAAAVAWASRRGETPGRAQPSTASASASASSAPAGRTGRAGSLPVAMSVPAAPTAGQPGAGALASTSVPPGQHGVTANVRFGAVVLEQRAVGITVAYPGVSVTADDDGSALAHVRFDPYNCLATVAPEDPVAAGCVPAAPEYADLPAPALTLSRAGDTLRLGGHFPTYTRPDGRPPVYTGRVYALAVTVTRGGEQAEGRSAANGELLLGTRLARTVDTPGASVLLLGS